MDPLSAPLLLAIVSGAGTGLGLLLVIVGIRGRRADSPRRPAGPPWWHRFDPRTAPHGLRRLALAALAALAVGTLTGWPVAAALTGLAVWVLPAIVGPDREHRGELARIEAIATFTESLRDTLSAAAGLEQALVATAATAPPAIRTEVMRLVARLEGGYRLPAALRAFADDLADATGDLVVTALVMAAERHGRNLTELLTDLATAAREQAALRLRVATGRARVRTTVRVVVGFTLAMAAGLVVFDRAYLHPYDSALGQAMLVVVGAVFATAFVWLQKMARYADTGRLLTNLDDLGSDRTRGPGVASWR